jgi:glycosyltransferase involved in cell wall biosynthesis
MVANDLSVCLLTYNHAHLIESSIQSVLRQTATDFEFVVSDDCSTDGTWEILNRLAFEHPRLRILRTPRNLGMAANANFSVASTSRRFIALLHHDDICAETLLEHWVCLARSDQRISFVFNAYGKFGSDFVFEPRLRTGVYRGKELLNRHLLQRWGCIVRGTALIRKSDWDALGGMRIRFGMLADIDLWMRLCRGAYVGYINEPLIVVRQVRPDDYPKEYKESSWSWNRLTLLYEIHATNLLEHQRDSDWGWWGRWIWFRIRISTNTAKWISYAVIRKNRAMLDAIRESETRYDLFPVRVLRKVISLGRSRG